MVLSSAFLGESCQDQCVITQLIHLGLGVGSPGVTFPFRLYLLCDNKEEHSKINSILDNVMNIIGQKKELVKEQWTGQTGSNLGIRFLVFMQ